VKPTPQLRVSAWAIRNPIPVVVLFIALVLAGLGAYPSLPIKFQPNIEFPAVMVTVTRNGAAPAELESQVTRPIENAMAGLSNIDSIASIVTQGSSSTLIQFQLGQDLQKATDDVRSKVDQIRNTLPRDIDPPIVERLEAGERWIGRYAVSAPGMSSVDLSWFIDNTLARTLQAEPGVVRIERLGGQDREINVLVDPDRLAAQGLTATQVNDALAQMNVDSPGGRVTVGGREQTLRVLGAAASVAAIRNISIPTSGGRFVRLSDVADVGDGAAESRAFALLDGRPVVGFEVTKSKAASEVTVEDEVDAAIKRLEAAHPGIKVHKIVSYVDQTRDAFVAMPASLIPTFAFMALMGFSLNIVTLLGLTLVIGILVDDAIVEIENIEKRVHTGMRPYHAAIEGADQIGLAVVATTLAIVAVFLPVGAMPGIPGQFFREFGVTVSASVLFSLVVARLLTPLMAAYFLKPKPARPRAPLPRIYTRSLTWALDHRIIAAVLGLIVFIGSVALVVPLKKGFLPEENPDRYYINIEGPPGATVADMHGIVDRLDAQVASQPETQSVFAEVGGVGFDSGGGCDITSNSGVNRGDVVAILRPDRKARITQIRDRLRPILRQVPDARLSFDTSGFGGGGVQMILTSETGVGLDEAALALQRQMRTLPGISDPRTSTSPSAPELVVRPKRDEAARLGVSAGAIATAARVATVGDIDANVSKLDEGERRIPIRLRLPQRDRSSLAVIKDMRLPTAAGGVTTLGAVADVYFQAGPAQINRCDRKRNITIIADTTGDTEVGDAQASVHKLPIMRHLPPGVALANQGEEQQNAQLFQGFAVAMASAIGLVYSVMVLLFRSFFKPFVILSALPTAIGGAFLALLVCDLALSIPSVIGFLMLMGLAAKNSILLVEYAIEREREGVPQRAALLEACRERARPIVMTTMAMAAGMLPTALALGQGSEFRQPMAVAVIGGLITSTILSLVLVPVVYEFVDDFERWLSPRLARLVTPRKAPGAGPTPAPSSPGVSPGDP